MGESGRRDADLSFRLVRIVDTAIFDIARNAFAPSPSISFCRREPKMAAG